MGYLAKLTSIIPVSTVLDEGIKCSLLSKLISRITISLTIYSRKGSRTPSTEHFLYLVLRGPKNPTKTRKNEVGNLQYIL
ncbi:hypothetical protein PsorP6_003263 [Peronosclerospora sorghi]|uniref:Uncharacterized protein n=1 Tax=Peronosclerospora sorghi TaxID=230839 RepID=A0ACC0VPK9_9STRA|nr:hypothetical protein PsorP6_003263 [Peronosclerospora sorghi]